MTSDQVAVCGLERLAHTERAGGSVTVDNRPDAERIRELEATVEVLRARMKVLESRVEFLERKTSSGAEPPA